MSRFLLLAATHGVAAASSLAWLTSAAAADAEDASALPDIVVTAQHLDAGRANIQTETGASTYTFDSTAITALPGGDNTLLNQVILQAADVAQDSFGQFR